VTSTANQVESIWKRLDQIKFMLPGNIFQIYVINITIDFSMFPYHIFF